MAGYLLLCIANRILQMIQLGWIDDQSARMDNRYIVTSSRKIVCVLVNSAEATAWRLASTWHGKTDSQAATHPFTPIVLLTEDKVSGHLSRHI